MIDFSKRLFSQYFLASLSTLAKTGIGPLAASLACANAPMQYWCATESLCIYIRVSQTNQDP